MSEVVIDGGDRDQQDSGRQDYPAGRDVRSVRSSALPSCAAAAETVKIPRNELTSDSRIENIVLAAPTSMVPTAMGRTTLYQIE